MNDLADLADLFEHPERFTVDEAGQLVFRFMIHVPAHLKAAERILLDQSERCDPFANQYRDDASTRRT
jgi:hypothetical protein